MLGIVPVSGMLTGHAFANQLPDLSTDAATGTSTDAPMERATVLSSGSERRTIQPDAPSQPIVQSPAVQSPLVQRLSPPVAERDSVLPTIDRQSLPLSPGDRLKIQIPGVGGEEFSGEYVVNFSGDLEVPLLEALPVVGLTPPQVKDRLRNTLLQKGFFRPELLNVSVQVLDYSPIQVAITGQVFEPGRVLLSSAEDSPATLEESTALPGDYPLERYLTAALKAIGGVRPTADITRVQVLRGTQSQVVDLSGIFTGSSVTDFPLISGDQVIIPDAGEFQEVLVRPSQITPDSVELYVSNVTEGSSNNVESESGINSASFKYGTNLAQALVAAQCVGGTPSTNANRRALLIQTDAASGSLTTSEYSVTELVSDQTKSAESNPFLMPEDAIACYDSRNANVRGVLGTVSNFLNPLNLLIDIFR
ncbi:MAG: polysaccharide biosynthesis/export family protein [Cyanobacteria bacterium J06597_16]